MASASASAAGSGSGSGSVVDRAVLPLLTALLPAAPASTPSSVSSPPIATRTEQLHRLHGASLVQDACRVLSLSASAAATACVMIHRYYHRRSLAERDVWSAAMGSVLLASKVEEDPRRKREVVAAFAHLYRRRRLQVGMGSDRNGGNGNGEGAAVETARSSIAGALTDEERLSVLRYVPPMGPLSHTFTLWSDALSRAEDSLLCELGFTVHWIPAHHPHKFILYFLRVVELDGNRDVAQRAWNGCNDACLLDLASRAEAEIVACAAILLAVAGTAGVAPVVLPMTPRPWWQVFVGPGRESDLSEVCNALLALWDGGDDEDQRRALLGFLPSLIEGGAFNDPGSHLWTVAD